jgi:hypothetical protein
MFIGANLHTSLYEFVLFVRNYFDKIEQEAKLLTDYEQYKTQLVEKNVANKTLMKVMKMKFF